MQTMGNPSSKSVSEFLEVAVPVPLSKTFTYRVPKSLRDLGHPQIGDRVRVSFGGREITGFAVGASSTSDYRKEKILEVLSVLDDGLTLSPEILRLTKWMAGYYGTGWGEVLRIALPGGGSSGRTRGSAGTRICVLGVLPSNEEIEKALARSPKQKELLSMVRKAAVERTLFEPKVGGILWKDVPNNLRSGPLKALTQRGWIQIVEVSGSHSTCSSVDLMSGIDSTPNLSLSVEQKEVINVIVNSLEKEIFKTFLLKGVTGSGKTEIYLRAIAHALESGRGAIVLVPEISLTSQVLERFRAQFGDKVAELHSGLTMSKRIQEWRRTADGDATIAIGARSAVFAPVKNLGIMVVDEEHESSYKQEEAPRYSARDVALVRARQAGACAVLGSATPSLESFHNAQTGKYGLLQLPNRAGNRPLPSISVVDLRKLKSKDKLTKNCREEDREKNKRGGDGWVLSRPMMRAIQVCMEKGEQALLFLNRRGFASCVQCKDCGWTADCTQCNVALTYHLADRNLRCHYCNNRERSPEICPDCLGRNLDSRGIGTQRVEEVLRKEFPVARISRMDRDTTRSRGAHGRILRSLSEGKIDILVGTQMVAKGHDYPGITLVGVVQADATLNMPDFRAGERTFQVLTQVAGRAGRGDSPGEVIVQTFRPQHYALRHAIAQDYDGFAREELQYRRELDYPPYSRMVRFRIESQDAGPAEHFSTRLAIKIKKRLKSMDGVGHDFSCVEILGPTPGIFEKLQGRYRWQVVIKDPSSRRLNRLVQEITQIDSSGFRPPVGVKFGIDVDPVELY